MENNIPVVEFVSADITNSDVTVIEDFNLKLYHGEWLYLTGKVGSGKTSIIRTIIGENRLGSGSARVGDFDLTTLKKKQIPYLRRDIGIIFQDFQLLMDRSIEDNLLFVLRSTDWDDPVAMNKRIMAALKLVGMDTKAHKMPHQLSGGEQQRVAIARALLNEPQLILADEPTGNLDEDTAAEIMNLLQKINKEGKTAVLMVTHNKSLIEQYPGRVLVCENGHCNEI